MWSILQNRFYQSFCQLATGSYNRVQRCNLSILTKRILKAHHCFLDAKYSSECCPKTLEYSHGIFNLALENFDDSLAVAEIE